MALTKWQRAKEEIPRKEQLLREAGTVVKEAEAAKLEAAKAAKAAEVALAEQSRRGEQAQREFQRLKERQTRPQEQLAEKVVEAKEARQDRLGKKDGTTAKQVEAMKAHESHLAESVHAITSKVGESREELEAHRVSGQAGPSSSVSH